MTSMSDRLDAIQARAETSSDGNFIERARRERAVIHEDVPYLLNLARKQQAALDAVRALHFSNGGHNAECHCGIAAGAGALCKGCNKYWPCPTVEALEAKP